MALRDRVKELRRVKASDLVPHPENWREHTPGQRQALQTVLDEVGFAGALLAREDESGTLHLIDGHERTEIAGAEEVPVLILDVTEEEAKVLLATYDPIGEMAQRNGQKLRELVESTTTNKQATRDLLDRLARPKGPRKRQVDIDSLPDRAPKAITKPGDVWQLGEHRLVCADCFDVEPLARMMGEDKAAMVLTDPPYAIYGSSTGVSSDIADDGMVIPFFEQMFGVLGDHCNWFAHIYVHCDWRSWSAIWQAARRAQITPKNCIVWDKQSAGLGSSYANTHEFVGMFAKLPPEAAVMTVTRVGQRQVHRPNLIHEAQGAEPDWIRDIVAADRVRGEAREHNAAKPVGLLMEFLQNSSDPGDVVLDLFGGSGSTLMAAEETGRRARLVEKLPRWCDVIVARWERVTGGKAERL